MRKNTLGLLVVLLLVILVLLVILGYSILKEKSTQLCNPPYIEYKAGECCADENNNSICDFDDSAQINPSGQQNASAQPASPPAEQDSGETKIMPYCGDGVCQANETCKACINDCRCREGYACRDDAECERFIENDLFKIYVSDKGGFKLDKAYSNVGVGRNFNFFVWMKKDYKYNLYCNYTKYVNWKQVENGTAEFYQTNNTYINFEVDIPSYLGSKSRTKYCQIFVTCQNATAEADYLVNFDSSHAIID